MKSMKNLDYMPPMVIGDDTGFSDPSFIPAVADVAHNVERWVNAIVLWPIDFSSS